MHLSGTLSDRGTHLLRTSTQSRTFKSGRVFSQTSRVQFTPAPKGPPQLGLCLSQSRRSIGRSNQNTRCAAAETQTLTRKSSSTSIVSPPGKESLPMLDDDGGSGFRGTGDTPYYRGDGSGGKWWWRWRISHIWGIPMGGLLDLHISLSATLLDNERDRRGVLCLQ
ncbi:hypothetical protein FRX31_003030, partial [Thalictrum thalictroides]